jgi:formiminotetrahydrofolate cyclodeaminase
MVCNLTVGKKRYADVQDDIASLLVQSEALRHKLTDLLEADVQAFTGVSTAYRMPRGTDEEKMARSEAIQGALKAATIVPMDVAEACVQVLDLCTPAAEQGNINAVSDAGVAALMAEAALRSAALNVIININAIKDESFSGQMREKLNSLLTGKPELKDQIYDLVVEKL